jgi:hypothetical protein
MYRHILGNTNLWSFNYLLLEEENVRSTSSTSSFDEPERNKKGETPGDPSIMEYSVLPIKASAIVKK